MKWQYFFTTILFWIVVCTYATPGSMSLFSPSNGLSDVSIQPTFSWYSATNAAKYKLQISTYSTDAQGWNPPTVDEVKDVSGTTSGLTSNIQLNGLSQYYWRVIAYDSDNITSASAIWGFKTTGTAPGIPADLSISYLTTNSVTIQWSSASGATDYGYQYGTSNPPSSPGKTGGSTSANLSSLSPNTTYYWRVMASNSSGSSSYSAVQSFKTSELTAPAAPSLNTPSGTRANQTLSWSAPSTATKYRYRIRPGAGTSYTPRIMELQTTSVAFVGLALNTTYYWQVQAGNSIGWSAWATEDSFTTEVTGFWDPVVTHDYALKYNGPLSDAGKNYNPIYYSYHGGYLNTDPGVCNTPDQGLCGGDCTNFISQCLKAGGLTLPPANQNQTSPYQIRTDSRGSMFSVADLYYWIVTVYNKGRLGQCVMKESGAMPDPSFKLSVGDVIQLGNPPTAIPNVHSVIITRIDNANIPSGVFISAHNSDRQDYPLSNSYPGSQSIAFFHHIPPPTVVGIGDDMTITTGPGIISTYPGNTQTWNASYIDQTDPRTSICTQWDWTLAFNYKGGTYTIASIANMGFPMTNQCTWSPTIGSLPTGYDWMRDENERICGYVTVVGKNASSPIEGTSTRAVFYKAPDRAAVPVLSYPASNATEIPTPTTFQWSVVTGATEYTLEVYKSNDLVTPVYSVNGIM